SQHSNGSWSHYTVFKVLRCSLEAHLRSPLGDSFAIILLPATNVKPFFEKTLFFLFFDFFFYLLEFFRSFTLFFLCFLRIFIFILCRIPNSCRISADLRVVFDFVSSVDYALVMLVSMLYN
ncbi:MAG: hypothetical protein IKI64_06250, partial [Clostridia bacterium]|nr:hypothetical protein [Clostridia bacterium]